MTTLTYFLTELDPRAKVKGSRDPLGLQLIWARLGRRVVGNLTTVTRSLPNFQTLVLGLHFADQLIEAGRAREAERSALFLKFEQLAGYSRIALAPPGARVVPLGTRRLLKRLAPRPRSLQLSAHPEHQILGNQRTYGLWGLYTVAARESGLVERQAPRPTAGARAFIDEHYVPRLSFGARGVGELLDLLSRDVASFELRGKHAHLAEALAALLRPPLGLAERALYTRALVWGEPEGGVDPTRGLQRALWETLEAVHTGPDATAWDEPFSYATLVATSEAARRAGRVELAERLDDIRAVEPILVAATDLYGFALGQNGAELGAVVERIHAAWPDGLGHLDVERFRRVGATLGADLVGAVERLTALAAGLLERDPGRALKAAIEQNAAVMAERQGAPWTKLEDGALRVQLRVEAGELTPPELLPTSWRNSYFLDSLRSIGAAVFGHVDREVGPEDDDEEVT